MPSPSCVRVVMSISSRCTRHHSCTVTTYAAPSMVATPCSATSPSVVASQRRRTCTTSPTAAGVANLVNFEFRQHPARRELRALVRDGVVGVVEHVHWNVLHPWWRFDAERPYGWSFDAELGGGWIRLSGSHLIDFVRWTLGEIADATGAVRTTITERTDVDGRVQRCTAEDGYTAVLLTAAGPTATIEGTATSSALRPNRLTVVGSDAVLELTNENPREEDARIVRYTRDDTKELFAFAQGDTYMSQMRQWAEIVRDTVRVGHARAGRADVCRRPRGVQSDGPAGAERAARAGTAR